MFSFFRKRLEKPGKAVYTPPAIPSFPTHHDEVIRFCLSGKVVPVDQGGDSAITTRCDDGHSVVIDKHLMCTKGTLVPVYQGGDFAFTQQCADGKFVVIKETAGASEANTELIVVENWFEELNRRVPVAGK